MTIKNYIINVTSDIFNRVREIEKQGMRNVTREEYIQIVDEVCVKWKEN